MRVNEIFYSLQGEGRWTGTPAVFVRFSGCNLRCDFCDTEHEEGTEMSEEQIVEEVCQYPAAHIVITGGEPLLQLTPSLVDKLHEKCKFIQIETNGTLVPEDKDLLSQIDWVTCSPKYGRLPALGRIDELKVVFDSGDNGHLVEYAGIAVPSGEYYLQPCDRGDSAVNERILASCIDYVLNHPQWKLSLQTHKMLNIP